MVDRTDVEKRHDTSDMSGEVIKEEERIINHSSSVEHESQDVDNSEGSEEDEYKYYETDDVSFIEEERENTNKEMPPPSDELKRFQDEYFAGICVQNLQNFLDQPSEPSNQSSTKSHSIVDTCNITPKRSYNQATCSLVLRSKENSETQENPSQSDDESMLKESIRTIVNSGADNDVIQVAVSYINATRDFVKFNEVFKNNADQKLNTEFDHKVEEVKQLEKDFENISIQATTQKQTLRFSPQRYDRNPTPEMRNIRYNKIVLERTRECLETVLGTRDSEEALKVDKVIDKLTDDF